MKILDSLFKSDLEKVIQTLLIEEKEEEIFKIILKTLVINYDFPRTDEDYWELFDILLIAGYKKDANSLSLSDMMKYRRRPGRKDISNLFKNVQNLEREKNLLEKEVDNIKLEWRSIENAKTDSYQPRVANSLGFAGIASSRDVERCKLGDRKIGCIRNLGTVAVQQANLGYFEDAKKTIDIAHSIANSISILDYAERCYGSGQFSQGWSSIWGDPQEIATNCKNNALEETNLISMRINIIKDLFKRYSINDGNVILSSLEICIGKNDIKRAIKILETLAEDEKIEIVSNIVCKKEDKNAIRNLIQYLLRKPDKKYLMIVLYLSAKLINKESKPDHEFLFSFMWNLKAQTILNSDTNLSGMIKALIDYKKLQKWEEIEKIIRSKRIPVDLIVWLSIRDKKWQHELKKLGEDDVESLITILNDKEKDELIRMNVSLILGNIGDEKAIEHLINALKDDSALVRSSATEALEILGKNHLRTAADVAVMQLIRSLNDKDNIFRKEVTLILGRIGNSSAVGPLTKISLNDESELVRTAAVYAIEDIEDRIIKLREEVRSYYSLPN